jgi:hypothetical protein
MGAAGFVLALAFAFPNQQGTRLLATVDIPNPDTLRTALCTSSRRLAVQFERRQPEGKDSTGRQTPQNFANTAGAVFRIMDGTVAARAACVLVSDPFLTGAVLVPLKRPSQTARCAKARYPELQADKDRPVVACWPIADGPPHLQVAIVEFARRLTNALASLVVVEPMIDAYIRTYVDYPAQFTGPGSDLWRADDGGEIQPEGFEVVFLLRRGAGYVIGIDWAGAEGRALSVHISDGPGQFKEVVSDSWYHSPL